MVWKKVTEGLGFVSRFPHRHRDFLFLVFHLKYMTHDDLILQAANFSRDNLGFCLKRDHQLTLSNEHLGDLTHYKGHLPIYKSTLLRH